MLMQTPGAQLVRAAGLADQARGLVVDQEKKRAPVGALVGLARSWRAWRCYVMSWWPSGVTSARPQLRRTM